MWKRLWPLAISVWKWSSEPGEWGRASCRASLYPLNVPINAFDETIHNQHIRIKLGTFSFVRGQSNGALKGIARGKNTGDGVGINTWPPATAPVFFDGRVAGSARQLPAAKPRPHTLRFSSTQGPSLCGVVAAAGSRSKIPIAHFVCSAML